MRCRILVVFKGCSCSSRIWSIIQTIFESRHKVRTAAITAKVYSRASKGSIICWTIRYLVYHKFYLMTRRRKHTCG